MTDCFEEYMTTNDVFILINIMKSTVGDDAFLNDILQILNEISRYSALVYEVLCNCPTLLLDMLLSDQYQKQEIKTNIMMLFGNYLFDYLERSEIQFLDLFEQNKVIKLMTDIIDSDQIQNHSHFQVVIYLLKCLIDLDLKIIENKHFLIKIISRCLSFLVTSNDERTLSIIYEFLIPIFDDLTREEFFKYNKSNQIIAVFDLKNTDDVDEGNVLFLIAKIITVYENIDQVFLNLLNVTVKFRIKLQIIKIMARISAYSDNLILKFFKSGIFGIFRKYFADILSDEQENPLNNNCNFYSKFIIECLNFIKLYIELDVIPVEILFNNLIVEEQIFIYIFNLIQKSDGKLKILIIKVYRTLITSLVNYNLFSFLDLIVNADFIKILLSLILEDVFTFDILEILFVLSSFKGFKELFYNLNGIYALEQIPITELNNNKIDFLIKKFKI